MKKVILLIMIICLFQSLCGCSSLSKSSADGTDSNYLLSEELSGDLPELDLYLNTALTENGGGNIAELEICPVKFDSVEEAKNAIKNYKNSKEMQDDLSYILNDFASFDLNYYPEIKLSDYYLKGIDVYKKKTYYYFLKNGESYYDRDNGYEVCFSRESDMRFSDKVKQSGYKANPDGTYYCSFTRIMVIPIGNDYYYSICFPRSDKNLNKDIFRIVKNQ